MFAGTLREPVENRPETDPTDRILHHAARWPVFRSDMLILAEAIMSAILVRDWVATKKSFSSMAEMIGKSALS